MKVVKGCLLGIWCMSMSYCGSNLFESSDKEASSQDTTAVTQINNKEYDAALETTRKEMPSEMSSLLKDAGSVTTEQTNINTDADALALHDVAVSIEPAITKDLKEILKTMRGYLDGLEYKFKTIESIKRKIKLKYPGQTYQEIKASFEDALRYTAVIPRENYFSAFKKILTKLVTKTFKVKSIKNTWLKGDIYSGLHIIFEGEVNFELQLHTIESFNAKQEIHEEYEKYRNKSTPVNEKCQLFKKMKEVWDKVNVPFIPNQEKDFIYKYCNIKIQGKLYDMSPSLYLPPQECKVLPKEIEEIKENITCLREKN